MSKSKFAVVVLLGLLIGVAAFGVMAQEEVPGHPFAQLSSLTDQHSNGAVVDVQMEVNDGSQGVLVEPDGVTIEKASEYIVVASGQITANYGVPRAVPACGSLWLAVNGVDVPNSNTEYCADRFGESNVLVSQSILRLNTGDKVSVRFYSAQYNWMFLDRRNSSVGPAIPAIIFSLVEAR